MDIPVARVPSGRVRERTPHVDAAIAGPAGAYAVMLGAAISTVGLSWDVEWHRDVGPDTFFTLPHLVLYSGSALAGIASLAMVLLSTFMQRAGRPVPPWMGGTPVRVFGGIFTAPLGYLVSGIGAASFLIYGLLDLVTFFTAGPKETRDRMSRMRRMISATVALSLKTGVMTVSVR